MKHLFRIKSPCFALALSALAFAALAVFALFAPAPVSPVRASAEEEIPSAGGDLPAGSYTLTEDVTVENTLMISQSVTIDLNGHVLSLAEEKSGPVIFLLGGSLTLKSDSGEGEIKGGNSATGGGIYVGGTLTLSGNVRITENAGSNLYLSSNNKIRLQNFTGEAGISMNTPGEFTDSEIGSGTFSADDKSYTVEGNRLKIAPLESIQVTYAPARIFPTTKPEALKAHVEVTGTNINKAEYIGQISLTFAVIVPSEPQDPQEPPETDGADEEDETDGTDDPEEPKIETTDKFSLGENAVLVTASGEGGETATAQIQVTAVKPELVSLQADYKQEVTLYFDSPLSALYRGLTVTGRFEDGIDRALWREGDGSGYEEKYIDERFTLSGDLNVHPDGVSAITVSCKGKTAEFLATVSKRLVEVDGLSVGEVVLLEGEPIAEDIGRRFVPTLPDGIEPSVTVDGKPLPQTLAAGIYRAVISFTLADPENYELGAGTREGRLVVNYASISQADESGEILLSVSREGGISPEWQLSCTDSTGVSPRLGEGLEEVQTYEISLRAGSFFVADPGTLTVRLLLGEKLRGKEGIKLFRLLADGTAVEIAAVREGDYLVFSASDFTETKYVLAAEGDHTLYIVLGACFGAACLVGAGAFLCYFKYKRKMQLK